MLVPWKTHSYQIGSVSDRPICTAGCLSFFSFVLSFFPSLSLSLCLSLKNELLTNPDVAAGGPYHPLQNRFTVGALGFWQLIAPLMLNRNSLTCRSSRGCWPAVRTIISPVSPSHAEKRCRYHWTMAKIHPAQVIRCRLDVLGVWNPDVFYCSFNGCPVGMEERVLFGDWRNLIEECATRRNNFGLLQVSDCLFVIYKGQAYSDDTHDDRSSSLKDKSQIMMEEPHLHKLHKPNLRLVVCRSYLCFAQLQVKPMWI